MKIYTVKNAENQVVWKVAAETQAEAARKVKDKFGAYSIYLSIN